MSWLDDLEALVERRPWTPLESNVAAKDVPKLTRALRNTATLLEDLRTSCDLTVHQDEMGRDLLARIERGNL
jgi:hypothetical protein